LTVNPYAKSKKKSSPIAGDRPGDAAAATEQRRSPKGTPESGVGCVDFVQQVAIGGSSDCHHPQQCQHLENSGEAASSFDDDDDDDDDAAAAAARNQTPLRS